MIKYVKINNSTVENFKRLPSPYKNYGKSFRRVSQATYNSEGFYDVEIQNGFDESIHNLEDLEISDFVENENKFIQRYSNKTTEQVQAFAEQLLKKQTIQKYENLKIEGVEKANNIQIDLDIKVTNEEFTQEQFNESLILLKDVLFYLINGYYKLAKKTCSNLISTDVDVQNEIDFINNNF